MSFELTWYIGVLMNDYSDSIKPLETKESVVCVAMYLFYKKQERTRFSRLGTTNEER